MRKSSIIIPVYNVALYLRECLDSVLNQTFTDWEAICVDDGSTDGCGAILDEYAEKDKRFKVIHQKNQGVSAARNRGLGEVSAEVVSFLDADDILSNRALEIFANLFKEHPNADMVGATGKVFFDNQCLSFNSKELSDNNYVICQKGIVLNDFVQRGFALYCYKKSLIKDIRFDNYKLGEDRLFLVSALAKSKMTIVTDDLIYGYRMRSSSATHKKTNEHAVNAIGVIPKMFQVLDENGAYGDRDFIRLHVNGLNEAISHDVIKANYELKNAWYRALLCVSNSRQNISVFQRFRIKVCLAIRSSLIILLLCTLPYEMKLCIREIKKYIRR